MKRKLDLAKHKIWKDKGIKPEAKEIYAYLYSQGFNKTITHVRRFILVPFYIYYRKTNRNYSPYLLFKGDIYLFRL